MRETVGEHPSPGMGIGSTRGLRWRVIPAAFLGVMGAFGLGAVPFMLFVMAYGEWKGEPLYTPGPTGFDKPGVIICTWCLVIGPVLLGAAVQCWRGRWRWTLGLVAIYLATWPLVEHLLRIKK